MSRLTVFFVALLTACAAAAQQPPAREADPAEPLFELNADTRQRLSRDDWQLKHRADGRMEFKTEGHQHVYMARVGKDGNIETFCANDVASAEKFLRIVPDQEQPR